MNVRKDEQLRELARKMTSPEDIAEIERVIAEAKGKIQLEPTTDFWAGKTPCWEMVRNECPAATHQSLSCWEIEGTYCKLGRHGLSGIDTSICEVCRVYKRWGNGRLIEVKLFGQGIGAEEGEAKRKENMVRVRVGVR